MLRPCLRQQLQGSAPTKPNNDLLAVPTHSSNSNSSSSSSNNNNNNNNNSGGFLYSNGKCMATRPHLSSSKSDGETSNAEGPAVADMLSMQLSPAASLPAARAVNRRPGCLLPIATRNRGQTVSSKQASLYRPLHDMLHDCWPSDCSSQAVAAKCGRRPLVSV